MEIFKEPKHFVANGRVVTACHASNTIVSAKMLSSFGILTSGPDSRQNVNLRHHSFGDISDIEALTFCRRSLRHLIGGFQHLRIFLRQRFCTTKAMPRSQQRSRTYKAPQGAGWIFLKGRKGCKKVKWRENNENENEIWEISNDICRKPLCIRAADGRHHISCIHQRGHTTPASTLHAHVRRSHGMHTESATPFLHHHLNTGDTTCMAVRGEGILIHTNVSIAESS